MSRLVDLTATSALQFPWVVGRGDSVVDTPGFEEVANGVCGELWSSVGGEGIRYAVSREGFPECGYEPVSTVTRVCHNQPVGVPINQHYKYDTPSEVGADVLEGVFWVSRCGGWHGRLGRRVAVACGALAPGFCYVPRYAGPE